MKWFKVIAKGTHRGAGSESDQLVYLLARDVLHVLNSYKKFRGVPRDDIPDISPVTEEERISLNRLKRKGKGHYDRQLRCYIVQYY